MRRRRLGFAAASTFATAALARSALAQSPPADPTLLTTTLTPLGGERAGNADGSIPAWTGGVVTQSLPVSDPVDVQMFTDEHPLFIVDASNLAEYKNMLTAGTQLLMTRFGFSIKVYPTHRTAAAPKYVYDNAALNVTRAKLEPAGGRFGFTNGYGGPPFPIVDTSDPFIAGAQLIWNHLVGWGSYSYYTNFTAGFVVNNSTPVLTYGGMTRFVYPYYDPNGSPETFDGYYSKLHNYSKAPASANGQEAIVWHTSNTLIKPDITWSVVNGQGRVRKAPDQAYDTPDATANGVGNYDDASAFTGSPQKYDWKCLGKQEMLVPYNCNANHFASSRDLILKGFPNPDIVRWEKHRVWVVEATLHPGERNTSARRRYYIDEDTWFILLGDLYNADDTMVKTVTLYNRCVPSLPGTIEHGYALWETDTGVYTYTGSMRFPPYSNDEFFASQNPGDFDPQQMAASASF